MLYLSEYRNSSLICLTETWLTETDPDSSVDVAGYTLIRNDRTANSGKTRGVEFVLSSMRNTVTHLI